MVAEKLLIAFRLGIELAKIMVLQYSNNETSISIGESVRDEDGSSSNRQLHVQFAAY